MSVQPPFTDFDFAFDANMLTDAQQLPSSADLFSPSESADLFGFLDNFWEMDNIDPHIRTAPQTTSYVSASKPYSNPHNPPEHPNTPSASSLRRSASSRSRGKSQTSANPIQSTESRMSLQDGTQSKATTAEKVSNSRPKQLLSSPQKRLNHIMSEQKRRNAIRDGYAQLIALLAPAGTDPGLGMPTRGRPKGSGGNGNGQSKGKSGVLFRAVEYVKWLEEGTEALRQEVARLELVVSEKAHHTPAWSVPIHNFDHI